jgi:hypothetical protein
MLDQGHVGASEAAVVDTWRTWQTRRVRLRLGRERSASCRPGRERIDLVGSNAGGW